MGASTNQAVHFDISSDCEDEAPPLTEALTKWRNRRFVSRLSDAPLGLAIEVVNEVVGDVGTGLRELFFTSLPIEEEQLEFMANFIDGCKLMAAFVPAMAGVGDAFSNGLALLHELHHEAA